MPVGVGGIAVDAQDEIARNAPVALRLLNRRQDAAHEGFGGHAAGEMGLGIEGEFGIDDPLVPAAPQVGRREVVEIPLRAQHVHPLVVDGEEFLEAGVIVALGLGLRIDVRHRQAVAPGQGDAQGGPQRSLDMQVQLRLRDRGDEIVTPGHASGPQTRRARRCARPAGRRPG